MELNQPQKPQAKVRQASTWLSLIEALSMREIARSKENGSPLMGQRTFANGAQPRGLESFETGLSVTPNVIA